MFLQHIWLFCATCSTDWSDTGEGRILWFVPYPSSRGFGSVGPFRFCSTDTAHPFPGSL